MNKPVLQTKDGPRRRGRLAALARRAVSGLALLLLPATAFAQYEGTVKNTNRLDFRQAGAAASLISGQSRLDTITVWQGGAGYNTPPEVTIAAPVNGTQATATAIVSGGRVTGFNITERGNGYTEPPVVSIAPPEDLLPTGSLIVRSPQFASAGAVSSASASTAAGPPRSAGLTLTRSTMGYSFNSGLPRYFLGDEITPPLVNADGVEFSSALEDPAARDADMLAQARAYWRAQPVSPGEVSVSPVVVGTDTIPPNTPLRPNLASGEYDLYYWSKFAGKVFANQPGAIRITWITKRTVSGSFRTKQETFSVSSATNRDVRSIYWTERSFDGPRVPIADNQVSSVVVAYHKGVPATVAQEIRIDGAPTNVGDPTNLVQTLWFSVEGTLRTLRAYNVEGRVLIEYLGPRPAGAENPISLGVEIVEISRAAEPNLVTVNLGQRLVPHDGDLSLIPSPKLTQDNPPWYGTSASPDGKAVYHAERETGAPTFPESGAPASLDAYGKVVFYWMQAGNFGTQWPRFQDRYWQRWSPSLQDYAHYTVDSSGSTAVTGVSFSAEALPTVVYQDSSGFASLDNNTQRLFVSLPSSTSGRNRSLLKFQSEGQVWYVNLYTQREERKIQTAATAQTPGFAVSTYDTLFGESYLAPISNLIGETPSGSTTTAAAIDYNTNFNFPGLTSPDLFSVVWQTWFDVTKDGPGTYTFGTLSDDGSVIYLDLNNDGDFNDAGELVVNNNGDHGLVEKTGTVELTGGSVKMAVGFFENGGNEFVQARWKKGVGYTYNDLDVIQAGAEGPFYTTAGTRNTLNLASTDGVEEGMVISGGGITGDVYVTRILDGKRIEVSQPLASGNYALTVQADFSAPIVQNVTVGDRINPPAGHELGGYISGGTCYYPGGYRNPFTVGVPSAGFGAIIPVNDIVTSTQSNTLTVRWFKKVSAPSTAFRDFYVPGKVGRYTAAFPTAPETPRIVIAEGIGTGDLASDVAAGSVYYQNNRNTPGYNPNEEHALLIGTRAYALRDDLNITSDGQTQQSKPFVLIAYTSAQDSRPAMKIWRVVREVDDNGNRSDPEDILFDRPAVAGTLLVAPYPLPLMPLPLVPGQGTSKPVSQNKEVTPGTEDPRANLNANSAWDRFTMQDRKGYDWVFRGPHDGISSKSLLMQYKYISQEGFTDGNGAAIAAGTILPFLRPLENGLPQGHPLTGTPLTIRFKPQWPANAPELRVGETLALAKFGLPQVRGQKSAEVFYQQSLAQSTATASVTLHDPTREKTIQLAVKGLDALPDSIATTDYLGKKYFQRLAPDLQERIWYDPLRGADRTIRPGTLVLVGQFKDEIAGEDYLHLNVLTAKQISDLKKLCTESGQVKSNWDAAIDSLNTRVETFVENPTKLGTYKVASSVDVGEDALAEVSDSDTAVDSYAATATGRGAGWVTMIFGNGRAFTPAGDPVQIKVFKVTPQLYTGELKPIYSRNPLDEQVTLRHTGDFAARPQDYEFEWRWAPGAATAPATYTMSWRQRISTDTLSDQWITVRNPAGVLPNADEYRVSGGALPFARTLVIRDGSYNSSAGNPGLVLKYAPGVDLTTIPGEVAFSATMSEFDGFVLYVNGVAALANNAPAAFANTDPVTGLVPGNLLQRQFRVPARFFRTGSNTVEIALYTTADVNAGSYVDFRLDATEETDVTIRNFVSANDPGPVQKNTNVAIISADPSLPFGGSTFVLNDRWYTMRYRPRPDTNNVAGTGWSRWMPPQLVEGWIKRVLRDINPFEQRVKDLFNNAISTDSSVLTQAGKKWEGDVALTLDNVESVGLIEIYETVLNRARSMSIDANTNDPDTNNALMLAAGYLSDLYSLLGNEAFADAANPTISTDDSNETLEVTTSRFTFENQVSNFLDEELALLRGRDASGTRVDVAPAYNRLYWNYTGGIDAGEALYATNYNIKEKAGSTADGVIDAADAQRMFPQGHGDAYGHYLTALKGYYRLLANRNFTWQRRAEAVLVLGQAVTVDFVDERKFAGAAANLAKTAEQICTLTYRQNYKDGEPGWSQYRDESTAPNTTERRNWGLDQWASRSGQGAYYHWVVANSMLPDVDTFHTGVEKIDRTTVPELNELASSVVNIQSTVDSASGRLNPLGLSAGAIPFDLDPTFLEVGSTAAIGAKPVQGTGHFGQIYERAKAALLNAGGAFEQASRMTRSLRTQENSVDELNAEIVDQERAFRNQLIEIFGRPYEGSVGPGKAYAQGYYGPDLSEWFVVDRPNSYVDTTVEDAVTFSRWLVTDREFLVPFIAPPAAGSALQLATYAPSGAVVWQDYGVYQENSNTVRELVTVTAYPNQFIQYSDVWVPNMGARPETGEIQEALLEAHRAFLELKDALYNVKVLQYKFRREATLVMEMIAAHEKHLAAQDSVRTATVVKMSIQTALETLATAADDSAEAGTIIADALAEYLPKMNGFSNDFTSAVRGLIRTQPGIIWTVSKSIANAARTSQGALGVSITADEKELEKTLDAIDFSLEEKQAAYELENLYRDLTTQEYVLAHPLAAYQAANERVARILGQGQRILEEREAFRKRAAAVVQGYRTKDVTFRVFRNEALEQYRSLYDLACRYTYMTAKAYDYETGMLGSPQGQALISSIVSSRSLGDVRDGDFFATTSTLGDGGLAGTMSRLIADYRVAEGRLGINNPDIYSTIFSLRGENFRILDDASRTDDDEAWRQTLEQHFRANLLADQDVVKSCRGLRRPDGRPVPGIIIPFSTTIQQGLNFFGLPLAAGDHYFTPSNFSTKIQTFGIALPGYVGMDEYAVGDPNADGPALMNPDALAATPYVYVIPTGTDYMLAPALVGENVLRSWQVEDQAVPLPFNLGAAAFNTTQFFDANDTLSANPWVIRQHQAFRPVSDPQMLLGDLPTEFTSRRLVGRSVWNSGWKIVIPAYTLLNNEQEALNRFARTVRDIRLFIRTYSYSGN